MQEEKTLGSQKYCGLWMKMFLYLLKCRDFLLLQATLEDYLQLPVMASIVSNIPCISRPWGSLKHIF